MMNFNKTGRDLLFWRTAGFSWSDRFQLLYIWLSPRFLGYKSKRPWLIQTHFFGGLSLYLRPASTDVRVLRSVFGHKPYEIPKDLTGSVTSVVDLGAYTGISTLYFAMRYPRAGVLAVEPDTENFECMQRNVELVDIENRVKVIRACVADKRGAKRFSFEGPNWGRQIVEEEEKGVEVPCLTINDILEENGLERVDILKIDIEGAEKHIFNSIEKWNEFVGWILFELHLESMSISDLRLTLAPYGRRIFCKSIDPFPQWIELNESIEINYGNHASLDGLVIPPVEISDRLLQAPLYQDSYINL
jgi:FkbM family methyltransferase